MRTSTAVILLVVAAAGVGGFIWYKRRKDQEAAAQAELLRRQANAPKSGNNVSDIVATAGGRLVSSVLSKATGGLLS